MTPDRPFIAGGPDVNAGIGRDGLNAAAIFTLQQSKLGSSCSRIKLNTQPPAVVENVCTGRSQAVQAGIEYGVTDDQITVVRQLQRIHADISFKGHTMHA